MMERITAIKAQLFDLQGHVCNGRAVFGEDIAENMRQNRGCSGCAEAIRLQSELRELLQKESARGIPEQA